MEAPCQIKRPEEAKLKTFFVRTVSISPSSVSLGPTEIRMRRDLLCLEVTSSFSPLPSRSGERRAWRKRMEYPHNFPNKKLFLLPEAEAKKPDGIMHECVSAAERSIHWALWSGKFCVQVDWDRESAKELGRRPGSMTHDNKNNEAVERLSWNVVWTGVWVEDSSKAVANMHHVIGFVSISTTGMMMVHCAQFLDPFVNVPHLLGAPACSSSTN